MGIKMIQKWGAKVNGEGGNLLCTMRWWTASSRLHSLTEGKRNGRAMVDGEVGVGGCYGELVCGVEVITHRGKEEMEWLARVR